MDDFLKIVSSVNDETRVQILAFIAKEGEVCVCDIENAFEMIQSRISRHLKILKEAGFLSVTRKGRWAHYSLSYELTTLHKKLLAEIEALMLVLPEVNKECSSVSC